MQHPSSSPTRIHHNHNHNHRHNPSPSRSATSLLSSSASNATNHSNSNSNSNSNAAGAPSSAAAAALQGATLAFSRQKRETTAAGRGGGGGGGGGNSTNQNNSTNTNTVTANYDNNGGRTRNQNAPAPTLPDPWLLRPSGTGLGKGISSGALLAATQAVSVSASRSASAAGQRLDSAAGHISRQATGGVGSAAAVEEMGRDFGEQGGAGGGGLVAQRLSQYLHAAAAAGASSSGGKQASASFIAATLAASRSASPTPGPGPGAQPNLDGGSRGRKPSVVAVSSAGAGSHLPGLVGIGRVEGDVLDTASIPPTTSLVSLFERKKDEDVDPVKKRAAPLRRTSPGVEVEARPRVEEQSRQKVKPKPKPKPRVPAVSGGPAQTDGREGDVHSSDYGDGMTELKPISLLPSAAESPDRRHAATRIPELHAWQLPSTPLPPTVQKYSKVNSPEPIRPVKTAELEPPTLSARAPGIAKMAQPTVKITTAVEPKYDPADAVGHHHDEQGPTARRLSHSSASSDDTFVSASSVQSPRRTSPTRDPDPDQRTPRATQQRPGSSARAISVPPTPQSSATPRSSTPNLPLGSLANAIVASNLASARSLAQAPPPVPAPRRHGPRSPLALQPQRTAESLRSQLTGGGSRSPSRRHEQQQQKQASGKLLQTLRAPPSSLSDGDDDDNDDRRHQRRRSKVKNRVLLGGGQRRHAHHEGSRRRWRDEVTPRERRRYEAVWASNKGLLMKLNVNNTAELLPLMDHHPHRGITIGGDARGQEEGGQQGEEEDVGRAWHGPEADMVVNVVVRDIWSRSRLPADELAEVWDLVYGHGYGHHHHRVRGDGSNNSKRAGQTWGEESKALAREEFVVGMWLIDQRLRGRKIPARVSQSVWDSVGGGTAVSPSGAKKR